MKYSYTDLHCNRKELQRQCFATINFKTNTMQKLNIMKNLLSLEADWWGSTIFIHTTLIHQ